MSNTKFRALPFIGVGRDLERILIQHVSKEADGVMPSCISCEFFKESTEECNAANGARPPARTIAFGCNMYKDKNDIPF